MGSTIWWTSCVLSSDFPVSDFCPTSTGFTFHLWDYGWKSNISIVQLNYNWRSTVTSFLLLCLWGLGKLLCVCNSLYACQSKCVYDITINNFTFLPVSYFLGLLYCFWNSRTGSVGVIVNRCLCKLESTSCWCRYVLSKRFPQF